MKMPDSANQCLKIFRTWWKPYFGHYPAQKK